MSAAPAATAQGEAPKKGGKKLIIIIVAVLALLLVGGGGAAVFLMKKKSADAEASADEGDAEPAEHAKKPEHNKAEGPPTFVPLDPFTVNLADRDTDRYAQIGIVLQVDDPHMGEEMKAYMPAIRNAILLILSHKSSQELLSAEGKEKLADEIRRESARAMGYEIDDPEPADDQADAQTDAPKKKKKKKRRAESYNPITHVNYASFIIQ